MKKLILINLALIVIILSSNCTTEGQNILGNNSTQNITENDDIFIPQDFSDSLSVCAVKLTKIDVIYTPDYVDIDYPMGDVPKGTGVCTDVIIRAYRLMGIDLQQEIHEDILKNQEDYPNINRADHNIDHRRVPNLSKFFTKYGVVKKVTNNARDYKTGDIIYWKLGGKTDHIGIVTHLKSKDGLRPLIVHNICCGQNLDDCLFDYEIHRHFSYKK